MYYNNTSEDRRLVEEVTEGTRIIYEPGVTMFTRVGNAILLREETE